MKVFVQAEIFTSFCTPASLGSHWSKFVEKKIHTSKFAKIPLLRRLISPLRFLFPYIWESFDLHDFDIVISSSGGWSSHGVKTNNNQIHICYLHTPPRYLYGYETALEWRKYTLIRWYGNLINHFLRVWDFQAAQRPDFFLANSEEVQKRIQKLYKRESVVIYPPVTLSQKNIFLQNLTENIKNTKPYYLTVSRLAGAKHIEVQIQAAKLGNFSLKIIGTGRALTSLQKMAGSNVEFLSNVPDEKFNEIFLGARAFLNTAVDEEFGISAVEALGRGVPVIAFGQAGLLETVINGKNGLTIEKNDPQLLANKISQYEKMPIKQIKNMSEEAFLSAKRFSNENFEKNIINFVREKIFHARTS